MKLFTTLVVFDRPEGGHYVKVTYPFSARGLTDDELIEQVLKYTPNAHVLIIPQEGKGIYDVAKKTFRNEQIVRSIPLFSGPPLEYKQDWEGFIDNFENWLVRQKQHLGSSCGLKRSKQSRVVGLQIGDTALVFESGKAGCIKFTNNGQHFDLITVNHTYQQDDELLTIGRDQRLHVWGDSELWHERRDYPSAMIDYNQDQNMYITRVQFVTNDPSLLVYFEQGDSVFLDTRQNE